jgi:phospholipid/cholesterol/gamma-HCH transport system substrate-binding protein
MSETNNTKTIAVGIFLFLGLVILVLGILTIGGQHKAFVKTITVKAIFDDVAGLQPGSNVWLSGVKIGTVRNVEFYGQSQVAITLNIEKKSNRYVRKDTKARISTDGLIGNKIVVLYGGTAAAGEVATGDLLLTERGISTEEMANTLQANNKNLLEITSDFKIVSKQLTGDKGTIGALINDAALAGKMKATIANLDIVSLHSEEVITNLVRYTDGLNKPGGLANKLVSDTVIFSELTKTVSQLQEASLAANAFTNKLKTAGDGLNQTNTPVGMLLHDQSTATDMRTTIKNLQTSSQKLDEDLEALQHNFLLRGFFRRKAKADVKAAKANGGVSPATAPAAADSVR